jgi:hypothetical protein
MVINKDFVKVFRSFLISNMENIIATSVKIVLSILKLFRITTNIVKA